MAKTAAGAAYFTWIGLRVPQPDHAGVASLPLTGERRAAFESYIADALATFGIPGAAVAVVQDGEVAYLQGFGVRELGGIEAVTPDTLMMIGSVTKSLTSRATVKSQAYTAGVISGRRCSSALMSASKSSRVL